MLACGPSPYGAAGKFHSPYSSRSSPDLYTKKKRKYSQFHRFSLFNHRLKKARPCRNLMAVTNFLVSSLLCMEHASIETFAWWDGTKQGMVAHENVLVIDHLFELDIPRIIAFDSKGKDYNHNYCTM
jgi:hypothetical protein